jgi:hypothetical protein
LGKDFVGVRPVRTTEKQRRWEGSLGGGAAPNLHSGRGLALLMFAVGAFLYGESAHAQLPLDPARARGQTITPVYEGWYANPDGTINLSWGYFNRNTEETVEIPVGPGNRMSPGEPDRGQPTHFLPGRQRGVFAVRVPADFGENEVTWTLDFRGVSTPIPGHTKRDWVLDAVSGAASGNTPPAIGFGASPPQVRGPAGATTGPVEVALGAVLTLSINVADDGLTRRTPNRRSAAVDTGSDDDVEEKAPEIALAWSKFRGPGEISFAHDKVELTELAGTATTTATFSAPGEYVARALVTDRDGVSGNQCCWTNAFVRITVTQ